jgi:hypothetical protein
MALQPMNILPYQKTECNKSNPNCRLTGAPNILAKKRKWIYDKCAYIEVFGVKRMWTRAELKSNAKEVLKRSYWEGLAAYIIVFFISSAVSPSGRWQSAFS